MQTLRVYSVSELVTGLRELLRQAIGVITVQGEVTGYRTPKSNLVYFELKDKESRILCFALTHEVGLPLEDGMEIQVLGYPALFQKSGGFHFRVMEIRPVGAGALQKAFEQLKQKLEAEGLFRIERKRVLPKFPERVGLITSPDAAAYTDVLRVLGNRWGGLKIVFAPVAVQGLGAARKIVEAVRLLGRQNLDVIILTRGGGSLEDLQSFNDEAVARAIFGSAVPVVTGVGHERDWTIADLVADVRAATPSNAAELVAPDRREVAATLSAMLESMEASFSYRRNAAATEVDHSLAALLGLMESRTGDLRAVLGRFGGLRREISQKVVAEQTRLNTALALLIRGSRSTVSRWQQALEDRVNLLQTLSPQATLERGYSVTRSAENGPPVKSTRELNTGQVVTTTLAKGTFISEVKNTHP